MPCATIHLLLADRVLADWSKDVTNAPLDPAAPGIRSAFLHGALAPDMGFIPGVDRFVSELSHYVRPSALAEALLDGGKDPVDEAFAWGWITHLIADAEIHPVIGRAVGERLHGDASRRIDAGDDVATHVSTEVGLDVVVLGRNPRVSSPPVEPHFDEWRIRHLVDALATTYEISWNRSQLLADHHRAVRRARWWPRALRVLASGGVGAPGTDSGHKGVGGFTVSRVMGLAAAVTSSNSAAFGFLTAQTPQSWVVRDVDESLDRSALVFADVVRGGASCLEDRNLETGGPAGPDRGHPASDDAAQRLLDRTRARGD